MHSQTEHLSNKTTSIGLIAAAFHRICCSGCGSRPLVTFLFLDIVCFIICMYIYIIINNNNNYIVPDHLKIALGRFTNACTYRCVYVHKKMY